jgi:hypothetical protein
MINLYEIITSPELTQPQAPTTAPATAAKPGIASQAKTETATVARVGMSTGAKVGIIGAGAGGGAGAGAALGLGGKKSSTSP